MSAFEEVYIAGMPQLSYQGLSENWLLKECGHRHWLALAELNNQSLPDFHDVAGNKAYAAFTAVKISAKTLEKIEENQSFSVRSEVARVGAARYYGEHLVTSRSFNVAQVSMLSTFVYRREHGNNQSVTRASFVHEPPEFNGDRAALEAWIGFAKVARSCQWVEHLGIQRFGASDKQTLTFYPSPYADFNGAYFLYFANFQHFIDRAEWAWFSRESLWALDQRELYFYGNINVGDALIVSLGASQVSAHALKHWCEIYNQQHVKIADVFTTKRRVDR